MIEKKLRVFIRENNTSPLPPFFIGRRKEEGGTIKRLNYLI